MPLDYYSYSRCVLTYDGKAWTKLEIYWRKISSEPYPNPLLQFTQGLAEAAG